MPKQKSPVRPSRTNRSRQPRRSRHSQPRFLVWARRALVFALPRTGSQLVALLLVVLGGGTLLIVAPLTAVRGGDSRPPFFWSACLLAAALAARLSPWWRPRLQRMSREQLRGHLGTGILVLVALCLTWHLVALSLGFGDSYPLPPPVNTGWGALVVVGMFAVIGISLLLNLPVGSWSKALVSLARRRLDEATTKRTLERTRVATPPVSVPQEEADAEEPAESAPARQPMDPPREEAPPPVENGPALPPIDLFMPAPKGPSSPLDVEHKARRIQETLASFNVAARVVDHHSGPVVTQFDVQPERGVKVRRITELQNDLALALAAPTIRIQAPVPGKPVVGIEIPNTAASMVTIRDILESDAYRALQSPLRVALGKDVAGKPAVIDLAKMPHLLIAGATGSGKSVCVNTIISCLLYQNTPDDVRLMMVDPKMVELTVYNGVPHLLSPVVTQMDKVVGVLQWAVREMERRYQLFADNTVRNILRYNEKMVAGGQRRLPYIVLIVDELADLMMVAPEDVEDAICRLAQLARAAGIHLVIATQRPSVDVVTGLIKANFPARIAFAMTSQVDSRTILDTAGAEKLLGRGDMLYQPPDAPKPVRLQGAYLDEQEIELLVEFWQRSPLQAAVQRVSEEEFAEAEKAAADTEDDLLGEAIRVVQEYQHASVSLLQRRLRVGYARAARLMDQLEAQGVVGPADGSKQRPVLIHD